MLDGANDRVGRKRRVVIGALDHGLQLGVMFTESVHEKNSAEMITVEGTNGKNSGVERVNLLYDVTHCSAWTELGVEGFGDEGDLSVGAKVLVALAKSAEDRGSGGKVGDNLVVSARDTVPSKTFLTNLTLDPKPLYLLT